MDYNNYDTPDNNECIPLLETTFVDIELCENPKDIKTTNIIEEKSTTITTCCICLENNDETSIILKCKCSLKIHSKCFKKMIKKKITKCPICSDIVIKKLDPLIRSTILVLIFWYYVFIVYGFFAIISHPSMLKYCDNNYEKCKYFKVDGLLVSNEIKQEYNDFTVKYALISSYNWTRSDFRNFTCDDYETHIYDNYESALIVKEKSIGLKKSIFVSYSNPTNCKLKYKWFNPFKFWFKISYIFGSVISLPFIIIINKFLIPILRL